MKELQGREESERDMYRQSPPVKATDSPRWCELCKTWGNHHTDRCKDEPAASESFAFQALAEARAKLREGLA